MILHRPPPASRPHVCPWWFGYSFDNPLRRLVHDPAKIMNGLVVPGSTVADIGCGLGYFTLGLAIIVGASGRVLAIDVQPQMIDRATRRARRRGVADRVDFRVCAPGRIGLDVPIGFALAFWMLHEVKDPGAFLAEVRSALRPGGRLLVVEPKLHVSQQLFEYITRQATDAGLAVTPGPQVRLSRSIVCTATPD